MESGQIITVRDERYVYCSQRPAGDGKFFGRYVFVLRKVADGSMWQAYGKRVAHNSRLIPATRV